MLKRMRLMSEDFARRIRKNLRRGPMTSRAVHEKTKKFKRPCQLAIILGRRQKPVDTVNVEYVATALAEATSQTPHDSVCNNSFL